MNNIQTFMYRDENLNPTQAKILNEAWEYFQDDGVRWISKDECLRLRSGDNNVYILTLFEGRVFEHLKSIKVKILSSHAIITASNANKKLPGLKHLQVPLFSLAMSGLVVCCTNVDKVFRQEIYDKIEMMNGKISRVFQPGVTHLITTEVGSAKYNAAVECKIPIMLPSWVADVWDVSSTCYTHASEERYLKHKCAIFTKYVICASGFTTEEKNELKTMIESEGGIYSGSLVCGTTTHLLIKKPEGEKYNHAKMWKIKIVNSKWVYDSIEAKYCLQEKAYQVESNNANTSTPEKLSMSMAAKKVTSNLNIDISMIANTTNVNRNCINEADSIKLGATLMSANTTSQSTVSNANTNTARYADLIKELNTIGKIKSTLFDGFNIFCENFDSAINERLKKLSNSGGAIRYDEISPDVTHIIVNQVNEKKCKSYVDMNPEVNILSIEWFIESCKKNEIADYKQYCEFKNALNSVKTPKKRCRDEKQAAANNVRTNLSFKDINDCLSQYLAPDAVNVKHTTEKSPDFKLNAQPQMQQQVPQITSEKKTTVLHETDLNQLKTTAAIINPIKDIMDKERGGVFYKKKIEIIGFDEDEANELKQVVLKKGGSVIDSDDENTYGYNHADYSVYPLTISQPVTAKLPVTLLWFKRCVELNNLIPVNESLLYQPIPRFNTEKPLANCVITISGYVSQDKDIIGGLCQLLGAKIQTAFSFKKAKNLEANTHLICKTADGPKYSAANNWRLPTVSLEWLIESCVTGMKADENKYSIDLKTSHEELAKIIDKLRRDLGESQADQTTNDDNDVSAIYEAKFQNQEQKPQADESQYSYPSKCQVVSSSHLPPRSSSSNTASSSVFLKPSNTASGKKLRSSQTNVKRPAKKTPMNIVKNYVSDEEDDNADDKADNDDDDEKDFDAARRNYDNDNENDESLIESNRHNLIKKKQTITTTTATTATLTKKVNEIKIVSSKTSSTHTKQIDNNFDDSDMNLIDSDFLQNLDNMQPPRNHHQHQQQQHADIPDSIDIKIDFLDQLKNKLDNIHSKNLNTSQSSLLNEQQALYELNKGKSKWGNSIDDDDHQNTDHNNDDENIEGGLIVKINDNNESNKQQYATATTSTINTTTSRRMGAAGKLTKQSSKKRQHDLNKNSDDDLLENKKKLDAYAPSQIQVTIWKEEQRVKTNSSTDRMANIYKS